MLMQGGEHALKFVVLKQPPGSLHINANAHMYKIYTNCKWLSVSMCKKTYYKCKHTTHRSNGRCRCAPHRRRVHFDDNAATKMQLSVKEKGFFSFHSCINNSLFSDG